MKLAKIIVLYDIRDNKLRSKILEICKYYGLVRIQYSVYGGVIPFRNKELLEKELRTASLDSTDTIRILDLCERCISKIVTIGLDKDWDKQVKIQIL